jgi:NAD(P)-dependent dehydrogenase (short-subunit alcohol dehydrogenase family)
MAQKIWFITGISSGLGKALAKAVVANGDIVIGTFRQQAQADVFNATHTNGSKGVVVDITNVAQLTTVYNDVIKDFNRVDVVVNNAGYGLAGAIEETSIEEAKAIFSANFFGTLQVTNTFLPLLRKQKNGHIIQISSHGGFKAFAGFGMYNASKFAVEGFSEALAQEVAPLGIKLTIVEPGPFRTGFAGNGFKLAANCIDDYATTAGVFRERIKGVDGKQEGDPQKAAEAILSIIKMEQPPLRLPLGKIALVSLQTKIDSVQKDLNDYRAMAESAVFV